VRELRYTTRHGVTVTRSASKVPYRRGLKHLLRELDAYRGFYLSSGYEYPGRYSRWDIASVRPLVEIAAFGREMEFRPLNLRGEMLNRMLLAVLGGHPHWGSLAVEGGVLRGRLRPLPELFAEEERSKQPSAFTILRALIEEFRHEQDTRLALVGAFGYDLLFQFDPIRLRLPRMGQKDLHLFLCDDIYFMDRMKEQIERYQYDFDYQGLATAGLERTGEPVPATAPREPSEPVTDHTDEEYMTKVETVREGMRRGDYYEVVLRRTFRAPYAGKASELFGNLRLHSPSPYEFFFQFGDEQLVGASPERFLRVEGSHVETSPISGTTRRTCDPLQDAENIRALLNSTKEESELTMCTDVDRNDKSRVCVPGSVKILGRRLIESYAGVFHTVDHVEGTLDCGFDSLDALLSHMWTVTMIGAPKKAAAQAIEDLEKDPRGWYAGVIGMLRLNGDLNTGVTIRTIHLRDGMASYGTGATLLYDSVAAREEQETRLKATAFFRALRGPPPATEARVETRARAGEGVRLLLVDHGDCFIHTLADYARQTGAEVVIHRAGFPQELIARLAPHIILASPGAEPALVRHAAQARIPVFGVGMGGIVEAFGGEMGRLERPVHGKASMVIHKGLGVFEGLPERFKVGRYQTLFARKEAFPACLEATAESDDGAVMGVRHRELPIEAVEFHPGSVLTLEEGCGPRLIENVVRIYGRVLS